VNIITLSRFYRHISSPNKESEGRLGHGLTKEKTIMWFQVMEVIICVQISCLYFFLFRTLDCTTVAIKLNYTSLCSN
jgi:hypothetical protein